MIHHVVSLPELDGGFILRCSCGWVTQTPDHRASLNATRKHKENT